MKLSILQVISTALLLEAAALPKEIADPTTVALSGDHALVTAWSAEGLATIDTSSTP